MESYVDPEVKIRDREGKPLDGYKGEYIARYLLR